MDSINYAEEDILRWRTAHFPILNRNQISPDIIVVINSDNQLDDKTRRQIDYLNKNMGNVVGTITDLNIHNKNRAFCLFLFLSGLYQEKIKLIQSKI